MKQGIVALVLSLSFALPAHAAPGDPHLVQGVLEWPAKLTGEPFVVVRADDGRWFYAEIKAAKRLESAPLAAGARVAILGTEAAKPHEMTAIALGSGDAAALAMALMPHVSAPVAASAPATSTPGDSPSPSRPVAVDPAQTAKTAAKPEPVAKPEPAAAPAPAPTPAPAPPKAAADSTAIAKLPAAEPVAEKPAAEKPTTVETAENAPSAAPEPPRWTALQGTVKVVTGHWVVVRAADGHLVLVDFSTVRGGVTSLQPGSPITVYGTPGEQKFQAMGLGQPDSRPVARPATVPPRR